ncbi:MAG: hypothetical protein ACRDJX_11800 [Solirubrobacteraceae bacterium]
MRSKTAQLVATLALAGIAGLSAPAALASLPDSGGAYRGSGRDYMNNAPSWTREATAKVSFRTSVNRRRILDFRGSYSFYCGAGTSDITARWIAVSRSGHFRYDFKTPNRLSNGAIEGADYVAIEGAFADGGRSATVSYLFNYEDTAPTSGSPYSTANPHALGCASWVRATVHSH